MADILETIAEATRARVAIAKETLSDTAVRDLAYASGKGSFSFEKALKEEGMSFICECKKASPSKGIIAEDFPYIDIAKDYEAAGASAISVLTEPMWFRGDIRYLEEISSSVSIPCLRKDFTVDEYMIYEAKARGASAVLIICSILTSKEIGRFISVADELGLSSLVEVHDHNEAQIALGEGARIVGVNNRDLRDFSVDPLNCLRLREYVPEDVTFVAESGIKTHDDITRLLINKVDAVLIGESVMRAPDKKAFIAQLRDGVS